jgi:lipopolysaccharide export system permease protein
MVLRDTEEVLYSILSRHGMISHSQMPYSMWVRGVQGRKLLNPTFKRRGPQGQTDFVAQAKEAELRVNMSKRLLLLHMRWGVASSADGAHAYFEDRVWEVPLPEIMNAASRRARDMTWEEIMDARRKLQKTRSEVEDEIVMKQSQVLKERAPHDLPLHIKNLKDRSRGLTDQIRQLDVELQMRPALSLGCLFFILLGSPVGIWFSRSDYLSSFITCFLPIVIIYYPLTLCGTGMAKEGRINTILMVWAADIVIAVVGLVLFWRLIRN